MPSNKVFIPPQNVTVLALVVASKDISQTEAYAQSGTFGSTITHSLQPATPAAIEEILITSIVSSLLRGFRTNLVTAHTAHRIIPPPPPSAPPPIYLPKHFSYLRVSTPEYVTVPVRNVKHIFDVHKHKAQPSCHFIAGQGLNPMHSPVMPKLSQSSEVPKS